MRKTFKYVAGVFVIALFVSTIESAPAKAGTAQLPPNHEELAEICLCFGPFSNGVNATGLQRNGQCAASQIGPFCFVDTQLMPLFWKDQIICRDTFFVPGAFCNEGQPVPNFDCDCPLGKMVLACSGFLQNPFENDNNAFPGPPPINIWSNIWAKPNGTGCRMRIRVAGERGNNCTNEPENFITHFLSATCAAPFPDDPRVRR